MKKQIEIAYQYLIDGEITKAVMLCLRIARQTNDISNIAFFLQELSSDNKASLTTFFGETAHLTSDSQKKIWELATQRWLSERELPESFLGKDRIYDKGIGELESSIKSSQESLSDYTLPSGMTPYDTAAFENSSRSKRESLRLWIGILSAIKEKVRARCLNFLITIEKQISFQEEFFNFQNQSVHSVINFFKRNENDIYLKTMKICELASKLDGENRSLLLTEIRRTIQAMADFFFPPTDELYLCQDGKDRKMDADAYLNRLQEFIKISFRKSHLRDLIVLDSENLASYSRKLNDLAGKGVHNYISEHEANYSLYTFFTLGSNLIFLYEEKKT